MKRTCSDNRYLIIRSWGYGFWAEIRHILLQLFVAEQLKRTPIVYWGGNCLYKDKRDSGNGFTAYFYQVMKVEISDIIGRGYSYYPTAWNDSNILIDDENKWSKWDYSNPNNIRRYVFAREEVLVADQLLSLGNIKKVFGADKNGNCEQDFLPHSLFAKYLRFRAELMQEIDVYWAAILMQNVGLAVHIRASDKATEVGDLEEINRKIFDFTCQFIAEKPHLKIYLLTDSVRVLDRFIERFKNRVLFSNAARSASAVGVHYQCGSGWQLGVDIIRDSIVAIRCPRFVGSDTSAVARSIKMLRGERASILFSSSCYFPTARPRSYYTDAREA